MQIENISIDDLMPYISNTRTHSQEQINQVVSSIQEFGFTNPVLIDNDNGVIAGHCRILAAKKIGIKELPCIRLSNLTKAQKKAYIIADNKLALNAGWNEELLRIELEELKELDFDLSLTGFSKKEFNEIFKKEVEEDNFNIDAAMQKIKEPTTKLGDIYQLGTHRLMCGDSTILDDVEKLMNNEKADMFLTDPPYNVNYKGGSGLTIKNDLMPSEAFRLFLTDAFTNGYISLKKGASAYIFHSDSEGYNFRGGFCDAGFKLAQTCIWVKNSMVMGRQDYQWQHEPVLCGGKDEEELETEWEPVIYGWNTAAGHSWNTNRKQKTVWYFDKPNKSKEHPTMKPIQLIAYPIQNSSIENDIILDLFGGSGSTLIACEQTDRICYMMELDEKYCDVIIKRWEEFTGQQGKLIIS